MAVPNPANRWSIDWPGPRGTLRAAEPTDAELTAAADRLAAWYDAAHNRAMMGGEITMSPAEVIAHVGEQRQQGVRYFLLYCDDELVGDADLRRIGDHAPGSAEYVIMLGRRAEQGRGLGVRFSRLIHAFAWQVLQLQRVYVAILPKNLASLRMFAKLGYRPDVSPTARAFAELSDDVTLSVDLAELMGSPGAADPELKLAARVPPNSQSPALPVAMTDYRAEPNPP